MVTTPPRRESLLTVDRAFQAAWIVYINGIEVPATSVSIAYGVWQIPEAEITMVPDPILQRLGAEDRVAVQVFYCDYWINPEKPEFRLMFDGEIVGWSYVNVQRGRAISFSCVDYIQIFTQLFFFFMSNIDDIAAGVSNQEIGVTINGVNTPGFGALYPYSLFAQGLVSPGTAAAGDSDAASESASSATVAPLITKPIDFVYNIVRALVSQNAPNKSVPASNFFAPWAKRTKFHRRFIALPILEDSDDPGIFPILRAVRAGFAVSAVARLASNIGSAGSMWEMLQQILQTLMMELVMLPTAPVVEGRFDSLQSFGAPHNIRHAVKPVILTNNFVKPQFIFGIPPSCNVFYPSQIKHFAYEENYITQPTRMYFNDEAITSYLNVNANVAPGLSTLLRDALAVAHPEEVNIAARAAVNTPGENGKNMLVYPEEFYKGPVVDRRPMPKWFLFLKTAQQQAPPATAPPPSSSDAQVARDIAPGDDERNVYRLYAKYEYFKERYSRRSGGLQLAFNPYPVPGFPCAVFDRRSTQIDVFGYIMSVRQTLTSTGWSTQTAFSYGRTFQEMFALMNKQFAMENETIRLQAAETRDAINAGEQSRQFTGRAEPVGAIGTAPPEPLREIRDVIQNFQRAEIFYRALFFRVPASENDEISQQQLRAEADRRAGPTEGPPTTLGVDVPPLPTATPNLAPVLADIRTRRAAFFYNELIDLVSSEGVAEPIRLAGIDATARLRLLEILVKMRAGSATETDLAFIREGVNRPQLNQHDEGTEENPTITAELNSIEEAVRGVTVETNIRGDRTIVPKPAAEMLFQSYEAAMRYNARPICTLDEYLMFLGEDAAPSGPILPEQALLFGDPRSFPAKFYTRIREYTPGPPETVPSTNITNTDGVSNTDGVTTTPAPAPASESTATPTEGDSPTIQALPEDFPDNRADWNAILLAYRVNTLSSLIPRN